MIIWPGRIDQADVGRVEASVRERRDHHGAIAPVRHRMHRVLVRRGVLDRLEPHPGHVLARKPLLVLRMQADHGPALLADEVFGGDPDGPVQACGLGHLRPAS